MEWLLYFNVKEITDKELVIHWSKYLKITRVETEYASLVRNEVEVMREAIETAIAVPTEKVEIEEEEE